MTGKRRQRAKTSLLPTYNEYLREHGHILLNVGSADHNFEGDYVSEFGIGCVQVGNPAAWTAEVGVVLADAEE